MSIASPQRKCLACQGEYLVYGYQLRSAFIPNGRGAMSPISETPYSLFTYVCLDCGEVGHALDKESLLALREEIAERNKLSSDDV